MTVKKDLKISEDEILEKMYMLEEEGEVLSTESIKAIEVEFGREALQSLLQKGLIEMRGEQKIFFTEKGKKRATDIIRRHRLAEVLFHEVFDVEMQKLEGPACTFEHIISEEIVDKICTFLGHPSHCPHGMPIPKGKCCRLLTKEVEPLVEKLTECELGAQVKIHYIVPASRKILSKLLSLGIQPGKKIKLTQKKPAYVIELNGSIIAIDSNIAENVYVIKE